MNVSINYFVGRRVTVLESHSQPPLPLFLELEGRISDSDKER